uniref:Uncharacterized protein n=2 Tax=Viruses TaxID=10239 RepID=A0AAU8GKZ9_9CAUD
MYAYRVLEIEKRAISIKTSVRQGIKNLFFFLAPSEQLSISFTHRLTRETKKCLL